MLARRSGGDQQAVERVPADRVVEDLRDLLAGADGPPRRSARRRRRPGSARGASSGAGRIGPRLASGLGAAASSARVAASVDPVLTVSSFVASPRRRGSRCDVEGQRPRGAAGSGCGRRSWALGGLRLPDSRSLTADSSIIGQPDLRRRPGSGRRGAAWRRRPSVEPLVDRASRAPIRAGSSSAVLPSGWVAERTSTSRRFWLRNRLTSSIRARPSESCRSASGVRLEHDRQRGEVTPGRTSRRPAAAPAPTAVPGGISVSVSWM